MPTTGAFRSRRFPRFRGFTRSRVGVAAAIALLMMVTSCGGGGGTSQTGKGPVKGDIQFSWWGSTGRSQKTQSIISLFEKSHPGVQVSPQPDGNYSDYWQKLTVEASAQNMPCVPQMQTLYMDQYDTRHVLLPLDNLVKSGAINVAGIPKDILNGGRGSDGKLYMIPTGAAANAIAYNATMAQKAGLPPLTNNMTWTQYQNWLLQAKNKLPKGVYAASLQGGQYATLFAWVRSHGQQPFAGRKLGFTQQTLINFWTWWETLRKAGATTPAGMMAEESTNSGDNYLSTGKVMAEVGSSNFQQYQAGLTASNDGTLSLIMFPKGPTGTNGEAFDLQGMSISANCNNIPAAAAWINFFTNNQQAANIYNSDNGAVTVTKLLQQQISDPRTNPQVRLNLQTMQQMTNQNDSVQFYPNGYSVCVNSLTNSYSQVAFGQKSMRQAAAEFFNECNGALGGY